MNPKMTSIAWRLKKTSRILVFVLTIPVVLSLLLLAAHAVVYHNSLMRMEALSKLQPMIDDEISNELWSAISGQTGFEECGVYNTIDAVNETLDRQIIDSRAAEQLQLTVVRRTMETLESYVERIGTKLTSGQPVAESEALLEEVRNVAGLAVSMLEECIALEISETAETTQRLQKLVLLTVLLEALVVSAAIIISGRMTRRTQESIHAPLERMEYFANQLATGDLSARVPPTEVGELVSLTDSVNVMADRIEDLIELNRQKQDNLRKSEMRLLQAQINPHFLYNTLDAIIWQAESGNSESVVHLTGALSDFFRISLASGADWIPVSQEMKHLNGYLSIQQTRYRDILRTSIDVPEEIGDVYMLKLLLQPLVENALYHGIKNRRGGGTITVTGRREGDMLCFTVADTGCGMSPEKLESVRAGLMADRPSTYTPGNETSSGFGLANVNERIKLYYGQDEGLQIESSPNGTVVSFKVPCRSGKEFEHD